MSASLIVKTGPLPEDWARHRATITQLYREEDKSLKDVMSVMAELYGHRASIKMYKSRITKWKLDKNKKQNEMAVILRKKAQRDAIGKTSSFRLRGRPVNMDDVVRYLKRKRIREDEARTLDAPTPSDMSCSTPDPMSPGARSASPGASVGASGGERFSQGRSVTEAERTNSSHEIIIDGCFSDFDVWESLLQPLLSPVPPPMTLPYVLLMPEQLFSSIKAYLTGTINDKIWITSKDGNLVCANTITSEPNDFSAFCSTAANLFWKQSFSEGRQALSKACGSIQDQFIHVQPFTLQSLLDGLLQLSTNGFDDITYIVTTYIAQMAANLYLDDHPWYRMWEAIGRSDASDMQTLLYKAWECVADTFECELGRWHRSTTVCRTNLLSRYCSLSGMHNAELRLRMMLPECEERYGTLNVSALYILASLGLTFYRQGRYAEAEAICEDVLERVCSLGDPEAEVLTLHLIAISRYRLSKWNLAEEAIREVIVKTEEMWGWNDPRKLQLMLQLESWLREWSREDEADLLHAVIKELMGPDDLDEEIAK